MENQDKEPKRYPVIALVVVIAGILLAVFLPRPFNNYAWFFMFGFIAGIALIR